MSRHKSSWLLTHQNFLLGLGSLLVVMSPSAAYAAAGPPHCTLATVAGAYAVTSLGQQVGGYTAALFLVTSDGKGNLSGSGTESLNGTIFSSVTATGTYTATYGCWFTATTTDSLGDTRNFAGTIGQNGYELVGLSTDAGTQVQFIAYRLHFTQCTSASLAGSFASQVNSPLTPRGPSSATQQWKVNTQGSGTGSWVSDFNGTISEGTATVAFSVNSDCTYTATVNNSDGTTGHFFGVGGVILNDVAWLSLATDSGWVGLATAYLKK